MKQYIYIICFLIVLSAMMSCGTSKKSSASYYKETPKQDLKRTTMKKREKSELDRLVEQETVNMRAVGIGNDYEEKYARREAMNDARNTLAGYIETAVISLTQEYHKKSNSIKKKYTESELESFVETSVSQKISTKLIGGPEVYDVSDGTIQVMVCLELTKPTKDILGEVYDELSKDDLFGIDYDKDRFIKDNMERLNELRQNLK